MLNDLDKRLVLINSIEGAGSGILISNLGLVISCYHNFFSNEGKRVIRSISLHNEGSTKNIQYSNNVKFCISDNNNSQEYKEAKSSDIWLLRLSIDLNAYNINTLSNIQVTQNIEEGEEITIIAVEDTYDKPFEKSSGKVDRIESFTKEHPNRFHIKLGGYPGYSGGGIFNSKGQLIGIINYIQEKRDNRIIASFIPNSIAAIINQEFDNQHKETQLKQVSSFFTAIKDQFSIMKLFHCNEEIRLIDQYIPTRVTTERKYKHVVETTFDYLISDQESQKAYSKGKVEENNLAPTKKEIISWNEAKTLGERLIILADPGMGKSTLLQREALSIAQSQLAIFTKNDSNLDDVVLPVFLRLKQISEYDFNKTNIIDIILEILKEEYSNSTKEIIPFLRNSLEKGKAVLLLDSLDEVPQEKKRVVTDKLNNFFRNWPGKVICSSRIVGYSAGFLNAPKELEIVPFSQKEITAYITGWFNNASHQVSNDATAEKMIAELKNKPQIHGLSQIPLLLSLLCSLYQHGDLKLPTRRNLIYQQVVDNILSKWVLQRDPNINWEVKPIKDLLKYIAYEMSCSHKQIITKDELFDLVKRCLYPTQSSYLLDPEKEEVIKTKLTEITEKYGALQNLYKGSQEYIFLHRTFQEYFTACYINDQINDNKDQMEPLIKPFLWQYDWHETISLLAGVMKNPLSLTSLVIKEKDDIFLSMFLLVCQCLAESKVLHEDVVNNLLNKLYYLWQDKKFYGLTLVRNLVVTLAQHYHYLISLLISDLFDKDYDTTAKAAEALGNVGDKETIPVLISALSHKDHYAKAHAAKALVKIGGKETVSALIATLSHQDCSVRSFAANALGDIADNKATSALIATLYDSDWEVRRIAAESLVKIEGSQAIPALSSAWSNEDKNIGTTAAYALRSIEDKQAIPILIPALSHLNNFVRYDSAKALGNIGDKEAVPALISALSDSNSIVRSNVAEALGQIRDKEAVPALISALSDQGYWVRKAAAEALMKIGTKEAISTLITSLSNQNKDIRVTAVEALTKIPYKEAVPALISALSDEYWHVRRTAVEGLGRIKDKEVMPILIAILSNQDNYTVKSNAAEALGKIGDKQAIPILISALSDKHEYVRSKAAEALGRIGDKGATPALIIALSDQDSNVRRTVAEALGKINDTQSLTVLINALADKNELVRRDAAEAVELQAKIDSLEIILRNLEIDKYDPIVFRLLRNLAIKSALTLKTDGKKVDFIPVYPEVINKPY